MYLCCHVIHACFLFCSVHYNTYVYSQECIKTEGEVCAPAHPGCGLGGSLALCLKMFFTGSPETNYRVLEVGVKVRFLIYCMCSATA